MDKNGVIGIDNYVIDDKMRFIDYHWYLDSLDKYTDDDLINELNRRRIKREEEKHKHNIIWII